jgi:hypothetical protein
MYADDEVPPHFHVRDSGGDVCKIAIETLEIIRGEISGRDIRHVLEWARANGDFLQQKWMELNERG